MSYQAARQALNTYRKSHRDALLGRASGGWFMEAFGGIQTMLEAFSSDQENKEVVENYATGTVDERIPGHLKLDYVCGMRREVRKQFVSGEDGIYTDVTPFRHGVTSAFGAELFDNAFDQVLTRKAK